MGTKTQLFNSLRRWRLLVINQRLATLYIPGLLLALSLFSLFFLSPNHSLQREAFDSSTKLHNYYLIQGALIGLVFFSALLALYKKNGFFIIASSWVLCNLHLGSMALGLDAFWLQYELPKNSIIYINQVVTGAYFIISQQLIQTGLSISPYSNKNNLLLGLVTFFVFAVSLIPYAPLFNAALALGIPLALILGLIISVKHIKPKINALVTWQIILLASLVCGLLAYVFVLIGVDTFIISRFTAFTLLLLANNVVTLGIINRIRELRSTQLELRANYQNSPFAVLKIDEQGRILRSNRAFRRLCSKLSLPLPAYWQTLFPEQDWSQIIKKTQSGHYTEIQVIVGSPLTLNPLLALHANSTSDGYVLTLQDITLYTNTLNRLKVMADNDPVTQALNQRGIEKSLKNTFKSLAKNQPCFVAYLDVNHVNRVNRIHGHSAGEALLQEVSQRIKEVTNDRYDFGRIDSDDFVFLLNKTSAEQAKQLAKSITKQLNGSSITTQDRNYKLNVHLGLVEVSAEMDPQAALRTAQGACMDARRRGIEFLVYEHNSKEMQDRTEELMLFEDLESGGTRGLFVEMQPLMNIQDPLSNLKVEVLLRVRRSNGELIPLHTFIPAAEENGAISIIDKWVFAATLEWMCSNSIYLEKINQINVNLSGHSLNNNKFIEDLFVILDKYAHVLHRLCVEITEGVALEDLNRTRDFMLRLQKKGVRIALDDFGAGYTSFSYLRELPANSIKIDGALIQDMLSKESNIAIVRTIVELAKNLGMQCIAEWVEDVDTLKTLKGMGVNYVQGFVVSRARSPEEIVAAKDIRDLVKDADVLQLIQEIELQSVKSKT